MIIFIAINSVVSLIYAGLSTRFEGKSRHDFVYKAVICTLLPVMGLFFFIAVTLLRYTDYTSESLLSSYSEYVKADVKALQLTKANLEKERNIVPVIEAIEINKSNVKRGLLIDILKEDPSEYIEILQQSLQDKDTEMSHYAAAALMEIKRQFALKLEEVSVKYEKDRKNSEILREYADIINKYLKSGLLDTKSERNHRHVYSNVLQELLAVYDKDEQYFIDKIENDIQLGNYATAKEYCSVFYKSHNNTENTYLMYMKLFYALGDHKNLNRTISSLKHSKNKLSPTALNALRFWTKSDR